VFVYSSGKLVAEYSTAAPPPNPTTQWTVTDQLGSPRILTNSLGEVVSRRDFMPFGEEISPDGTHRLTNLKYNFGDNVRQKFTGYQKDEETQLDFAEARMYQNLHGRFTAVDPLLASGKSANPQTFNRYVYVLNNPLRLTDPTGLQVGDWTGPVYTDGNTYSPNRFKNSQVLNESRYVDAADGYTYSAGPNGSMNLGKTASIKDRSQRITQSMSSNSSAPGVFMPRIGMGVDERMAQEVQQMGRALWDKTMLVAPDYGKVQLSLPLIFDGNLTLSRDYNLFMGGGFTLSKGGFNEFIKQAQDFDFLHGNKNLGFKLGVSGSVGWFTTRNMPEAELDGAIGGTSVSGVVPIGPISVGFDKSLPSNGSSFLNSPTAFELGTPTSGGVGISKSEKIFDLGDWIEDYKRTALQNRYNNRR